MQIKTHIINLEKSVERRSFMEAQLQFFPELDYEFIKAIDASTLTEDEINSVYDEELAIKNIGRAMVRGEIGVALSQLNVMQKIINNESPGLIMEDDLLISSFFSESLEKSIDFINSNKPRIVLFTPVSQYSAINPIEINPLQERNIYKVWKDASYAAGYMINPNACKVIINEYPKVANVIDNWRYFIQKKMIDIRAVIPHVVGFSKYGLTQSTINTEDLRDTGIKTNFQKLSIQKRFIKKVHNYYMRKKHRVKNNKNNVWHNDLDIIQPNF